MHKERGTQKDACTHTDATLHHATSRHAAPHHLLYFLLHHTSDYTGVNERVLLRMCGLRIRVFNYVCAVYVVRCTLCTACASCVCECGAGGPHHPPAPSSHPRAHPAPWRYAAASRVRNREQHQHNRRFCVTPARTHSRTRFGILPGRRGVGLHRGVRGRWPARGNVHGAFGHTACCRAVLPGTFVLHNCIVVALHRIALSHTLHAPAAPPCNPAPHCRGCVPLPCALCPNGGCTNASLSCSAASPACSSLACAGGWRLGGLNHAAACPCLTLAPHDAASTVRTLCPCRAAATCRRSKGQSSAASAVPASPACPHQVRWRASARVHAPCQAFLCRAGEWASAQSCARTSALSLTPQAWINACVASRPSSTAAVPSAPNSAAPSRTWPGLRCTGCTRRRACPG